MTSATRTRQRNTWLKSFAWPLVLVPLGLWMSIGGSHASVAGSIAVAAVAFAAPWVVCWLSLHVPNGKAVLFGGLVLLLAVTVPVPLVVAGSTWAWLFSYVGSTILATSVL